MPITVDHEQRRQKIAGIATDIIANKGLDGVTIRQVAAMAGFSTTIVTHYFATKRELLMYTWRAAASRTRSRVDRVFSDSPCDIQGCLEALLPINKAGIRDWKVYFAYWHVASVNSQFAKEQRYGIKLTRNIIRRVLKNMVHQDLLASKTDTLVIAKRLLIYVQGIAIQTMVNRYEWSPKKQRDFLENELGSLLH